mgnify:CR=1 FL=1
MSLWNYIQQGGAIMYLLLLLNIVGFALMIAKFFVLKRENAICDETASSLSSQIPSGSSDSVLELAKQEIASHVSKVESGINTIKIIATIYWPSRLFHKMVLMIPPILPKAFHWHSSLLSVV